ncbi:mortality factor 4-like protein 1 [Trichosurus vulpecula]|uniref:mortality factor 4-like protein 1 n=1 Tax=Trichosurus vulpecula TaxID=9337 RepID=UPI00186B48F9|nr:mortality factor 4-like protein 1 [Trichosurus vulpecula]
MAPKQAPKPEFQEGERVLCFHGPLLYEAKCLKVATEDKQVRYLIHYSGWNKNWDEWVPESRVLKYSEANLQKQRDLQRANQELVAEGRARGGGPGRRGGGAASLQQQKHVETLFQNIRITPAASTSEVATGAAAAAPAETPNPGPGRKTRKSKQKTGGGDGGAGPSTSAAREPPQPQPQPRRRARGVQASTSEAAAAARPEPQVEIPAELKPLLVRDWELVTQEGRLFTVPAAKTVDAILDEYVAFRQAQGRRDSLEYAAEELVGGIRDYFNVLLSTQLLYENERPQHDRLLAAYPDEPVSRLYGGPHLLRLFVRIGAMMSQAQFDEKSLVLLFGHLHDFLGFLARDPDAFFNAAEYRQPAHDLGPRGP